MLLEVMKAGYSQLYHSQNNCYQLKPFSDKDLMKKCIIDAAKFVCPKSVKDFENISLSRSMITKGVEEVAGKVEST